MTLDELKKFEADHPEYASHFEETMKGIDDICKEELGKAFKAIDKRLEENMKHMKDAFAVPEEDQKAVRESLIEFFKQLDSDIKKNVADQFAKNKK